jgi:DNA repair exonuclease SbcCD nuclease subunit
MANETKFIVIGDPHIKLDNILDVDLCLERLIGLANERQPDFIVILGDVNHNHEKIHTVCLNKAYEFIDKMREIAPTYVLVGNHDMINHVQFLTSNHWLNGMKEWENVVIVDKVKTLSVNGDLYVFCPYVPNGRFEEALNTCDVDWKESSCIFAHQEFYGCSMNAITSVEGDRWGEEYPNIISGHIHVKQKIQNNIYYPGSMLQHSFGESSKNIIAIVTFNDNTDYILEEVDLKLPRKKTIHTTIEDIDDNEYELSDTGDKLKITISGVYEQFKSFRKTNKYKKMIKSGIKVVFKPKKISLENADDTMSNESNFKDVLSLLINKEKSPYLTQIYEEIINDKIMSPNDIIFIS